MRLEIHHDRASIGQEDPRLFAHHGELYVSFVGVDPMPDPHHPQKIRANVLDLRRLDRDYRVNRVWYPHYPERSIWEKNWAFFSHDGCLYAIYSIKPHIVFKINGEEITEVIRTGDAPA